VGIVIEKNSGKFVILHIKDMGLEIESESIYEQVIFLHASCCELYILFWDLNVYQS
jgi:hypothetical protein